jgi:hypothetical protein
MPTNQYRRMFLLLLPACVPVGDFRVFRGGGEGDASERLFDQEVQSGVQQQGALKGAKEEEQREVCF